MANITNENGTFRSYSSMVSCYRTRKRMLRPDHYEELLRHIQTTRVGQWLQGVDLLTTKVKWWCDMGTLHIWRHEPGDVMQTQGEWTLFRPQSVDRFWWGNTVVKAVARQGIREHEQLLLSLSPRQTQAWAATMEATKFEPWSEVRLQWVADSDQWLLVVLKECVVVDRTTAETNAMRTKAVWFGVASEWGAAYICWLYVCDLQQATIQNDNDDHQRRLAKEKRD